MADKISIVKFCRDYIDEMFSIHCEVILEDDKMSKENFYDEFCHNSRKYFVALCGEEVVGYVGVFECDTDENIIGIAVKKSFQNCGIGTKLLENVAKIARKENKKTISLEVDEHNTNAINFYKRNGFSVTNIRKKYYKDSDAFIMFRYL